MYIILICNKRAFSYNNYLEALNTFNLLKNVNDKKYSIKIVME